MRLLQKFVPLLIHEVEREREGGGGTRRKRIKLNRNGIRGWHKTKRGNRKCQDKLGEKIKEQNIIHIHRRRGRERKEKQRVNFSPLNPPPFTCCTCSVRNIIAPLSLSLSFFLSFLLYLNFNFYICSFI